MAKHITAQEAAALIPEGCTIMLGGFMGCGSAHDVVDALAQSGKKGFTVICNDGGMPSGPLDGGLYGAAKLIHNRQVSHLIASHVGLNPEVAQQMNSGEMKVSLIPQGSLVEMIRAGGAGLGAVVTGTGVGTIVEDSEFVAGKMELEGKRYLVMKPLKADVALVGAHLVDERGNIWYKGTTRNFNLVMATAAETVIVEADKLVAVGDIVPENVMTSSVFVDYIVDGGRDNG